MDKNFEQSLKGKLTEFQYPYDNQSWKNFAKKLPKSLFYQSKIFIASSAVVLIIAAVFIFYNLKPDTKNQINHLTTNKQKSEVDHILDQTQNTPLVETHKMMEEESAESTDNFLVNNKDEQISSNTVSTNENKDNEFAFHPIIENNDNFNSANKFPLALFNVSVIEGCQPLSVKISPLEISDTIICFWEFGDGKKSNETNPVHTYSEAGDYNIVLNAKYKNSEKFSTSSHMISVFEKPVADFEWKNDDNHYQFSNSSKNGVSCLWNFNYKQLTSEIDEPEISFNEEGQYIVSIISLNEFGCKDTLIKTVAVDFGYTIFFPDAFSPNNDGICDLFGPEGTGISCSTFDMKIYDGYGKLVFHSVNPDQKWDGRIIGGNQEAPRGIYKYEVYINSEFKNIRRTGTFKLIK